MSTREGLRAAVSRPAHWARQLYDWVLGWADSPYGPIALFVLAVAEASFFLVPPDVLLIALCIGRPRRSLSFAGLCTLGSVVGGLLGYVLGYQLFAHVGRPILEFYGMMDAFGHVGQLYRENMVLALGTAGFTPVPYKVFTIAAGAFQIPILAFVVISAVSRGARFLIVAGLIRLWGPEIRTFIDRYFNALSIVLVILLVLGFLVIRHAL